ncbi:MAG: hypothetical protein JW904_01480 [Spirochaetales bacterium]|nr:hypothetical protein [Spirochaetales bacterium]
MKKTFLIFIITAILISFSGSCIKGNPKDWPKETMYDLEVFRYAPQNPTMIMAWHFDVMLHDPDYGEQILAEASKEGNSINDLIPFYEKLDYIHGMTLYNTSADFSNMHGDLQKMAILFSVEMDKAALLEYIRKESAPGMIKEYKGITLVSTSMTNTIAILTDKKLLVGDVEVIKSIIDGNTMASGQSRYCSLSENSMMYLYVDVEEIYNDKLSKNEIDLDDEDDLRMKQVGLIEFALNIDTVEATLETAIQTSLTEIAQIEKLEKEFKEGFMSFFDFSKSELERTVEPWGYRFLQKIDRQMFYASMIEDM